MRTTSVGPHPEIRFFSRTWRITPGKAYRNSQYFRLYLARNSPERNAWWSGDPGIRFLSAPYVRNSFIEEIKNLEELNGQNYSHLYQQKLDDYVNRPLEGLSGDERIIQHAVNKTVSRVHQSMEALSTI